MERHTPARAQIDLILEVWLVLSEPLQPRDHVNRLTIPPNRSGMRTNQDQPLQPRRARDAFVCLSFSSTDPGASWTKNKQTNFSLSRRAFAGCLAWHFVRLAGSIQLMSVQPSFSSKKSRRGRPSQPRSQRLGRCSADSCLR